MTYYLEHDPILRAGFARCTGCGRINFPVDADWLPGGLILASYPAMCSHHARGAVMIVDPATLPERDPGFDLDRYFTLELYLPGRRCAGSARSGRRCRSPAQPGSEYCAKHPLQVGETAA
ncbi:MAG: hypothetical protein ABSF03_33550 [Streptosporangiaceae bacterium]|jgi:hypothetical protein